MSLKIIFFFLTIALSGINHRIKAYDIYPDIQNFEMISLISFVDFNIPWIETRSIFFALFIYGDKILRNKTYELHVSKNSQLRVDFINCE